MNSGNSGDYGSSGEIEIYSGNSAVGDSGHISLDTGESKLGRGGDISLLVGKGQGQYNGGNIQMRAGAVESNGHTKGGNIGLLSGSTNKGDSGVVIIESSKGGSSQGSSGIISIQTGSSGKGNTGQISLKSGNGIDGKTGDISLEVGHTTASESFRHQFKKHDGSNILISAGRTAHTESTGGSVTVVGGEGTNPSFSGGGSGGMIDIKGGASWGRSSSDKGGDVEVSGGYTFGEQCMIIIILGKTHRNL